MTENDNKPEENNKTNSSTAGSAGAPRPPVEFPGGFIWAERYRVFGFLPGTGLTISAERTVSWIGTVNLVASESSGFYPDTYVFIGVDQDGNDVIEADPEGNQVRLFEMPESKSGTDLSIIAEAAGEVARDAHEMFRLVIVEERPLDEWLSSLEGDDAARVKRGLLIMQGWLLGVLRTESEMATITASNPGVLEHALVPWKETSE